MTLCKFSTSIVVYCMCDGIKITDIISALSAAIGALTGLIMAWLAYKEFLKSPVQKEVSRANDLAHQRV